MHYIQLYILDSLVYARYLRNRDMRPANVESNLYQYHLQQLLKDGYVQKTEHGYTLTGLGLAYADKHSTKLKKPRVQPKLITVLFADNGKGELLIRRKQLQPFIGMYGLVIGKVHVGDTVTTAATREFTEKISTNTDGITFKQFGMAHIMIMQNDFIISDYWATLITVKVPNNIAMQPVSTFYNPTTLPQDQLSPGTKELLVAYDNQLPFSEHIIAIE